MANAPYTLYSPAIPRETNEFIPAKDLKDWLVGFYSLYKPENTRGGHIEEYLKYARGKGVLALRTVLKQKYGCNLDEADSSEVGWQRVFRQLQEYYAYHANDKSQEEIERIHRYAKDKGLLALDTNLREKYGMSLSDFVSRGLHIWKNNWASVLQQHHADTINYELLRFYAVVERMNKNYGAKQELSTLVEWGVKHTRNEVNEKLLHKYKFCLDDVKLVKGNTMEERKINLRTQLVEFYQKYDPAKLGPGAAAESKNLKKSASKVGYDQQEKQSSEMLEIDRLVADGVIHLEVLNDMLQSQYGVGLEDKDTAELRKRLIQFYQDAKVPKSMESIEEIVKYAITKGLDAMNEKLMLTYGKGIPIEDL